MRYFWLLGLLALVGCGQPAGPAMLCTVPGLQPGTLDTGMHGDSVPVIVNTHADGSADTIAWGVVACH